MRKAVEKNTIPFLSMAAIELRRIAERAPDVAAELCMIAGKLDAEAKDLSQYLQG